MTIKEIVDYTSSASDIRRLPEYEPAHYEDQTKNPIFMRKVNFRLNYRKTTYQQPFLYNTPVQDVLGYCNEQTGQVIALYLVVDSDEELVGNITGEIGPLIITAGVGPADVTAEEIVDSSFSWYHHTFSHRFNVDLCKWLNFLDNYQSLKGYYTLVISRYHSNEFDVNPIEPYDYE